MKKLFMMFIMSVLALSVLISCEESKKVNNTTKTEGTKAANGKKDINDLVTIKEEVNKEDVLQMVTR